MMNFSTRFLVLELIAVSPGCFNLGRQETCSTSIRSITLDCERWSIRPSHLGARALPKQTNQKAGSPSTFPPEARSWAKRHGRIVALRIKVLERFEVKQNP